MNSIQVFIFLFITGFNSQSIATHTKPTLLQAIVFSSQDEFLVVKSGRQNNESKIQINPNYIEKDTIDPKIFPPKAQID